MSKPKNHHWLPQFMMRPWSGEDGLVVSVHKPHKKISWSRVSTKSLGSELNLYTTSDPTADPYRIERDVLGKDVDNLAAIIRDRLLAGEVDELSLPERARFALFLTFLNLRRPKLINSSKDEISEYFRDVVKNSPKAKTGEIEPDQFYNDRIKGKDTDLIYATMIDAALEPLRLLGISALHWRIVDFSSVTPPLVLSDRPLQLWGTLEEVERIFLPLSPTSLFVAAKTEYFSTAPILRDEFRQAFAIQVIGDQFRAAERFVIVPETFPIARYAALAEINLRKHH